ncbi:hypothetical protein L9F63_016409, partial [Diploptera punctata]
SELNTNHCQRLAITGDHGMILFDVVKTFIISTLIVKTLYCFIDVLLRSVYLFGYQMKKQLKMTDVFLAPTLFNNRWPSLISLLQKDVFLYWLLLRLPRVFLNYSPKTSNCGPLMSQNVSADVTFTYLYLLIFHISLPYTLSGFDLFGIEPGSPEWKQSFSPLPHSRRN